MKQEEERRRDEGRPWLQRSIGRSSAATFFLVPFYIIVQVTSPRGGPGRKGSAVFLCLCSIQTCCLF